MFIIKKLRAILLFLVVMVLTITPITVLGAAEEENELDKIVGTFRGSYYATQGHTGLTLKVQKSEEEKYMAEFYFYSVPENSSVPYGKYMCEVSYSEESGIYYIKGVEWVENQ